ILDHLCEACREHFDTVKQSLADRGISFPITPRMVRGLDYYTRTTFEIVHGALGAQNSVLGGGRYDGLAEDLGSKTPAPGIGFSIGEDRLVLILEELRPDGFRPVLDLFVAPVGEAAVLHAGPLAAELRRAGASVEVPPGGRLKRLMELANKLGARHTLILGENEIASGKFSLKDMSTGSQQELSREQLIQLFSNR
ncbi:MAG: histidine--tRNA ligase, partial [bacterium]|nr:histidine--tRNA ligase [bacterium]